MRVPGTAPTSRDGIEEVAPTFLPETIIRLAGPPNVYTQMFKYAGVKALHAVSTAMHVEKAEALGVDAVICKGYEGGGHKSITGLIIFAMIPMVADTVKIPMIAAGGIADARGLVAVLALGADDVYIGNRFIASDECDAHPNVKKAVIQGHDACTVAIEKWIVTGRALKNSFTQKYAERQQAGASAEALLQILSEHSMYRGLVQGDIDQGEVPCGQNAGIIKSQFSSAALIESIVNEIPSVFERMNGKTAG